MLEVRDLTKHFPIRAGLLGREVARIRAVDGVSFSVRRGETLALVGESGSGKTTASRCIVRAMMPTSGEVLLRDRDDKMVDVARVPKGELRPLRAEMQMIFQDPYSSLDPRMTILDIIGEPLLINGMRDAAERRARVEELLELVKLPPAYINRFPHAFSGGQRQRVGIARSLALQPRLVVADEPVSALDVSVQAQIVNLLLDLQDKFGVSFLFVAHDLSVVKHVSDRVAVMYLGKVVEIAANRELFETPMHPYTEALLSAVPKPDPRLRANRIVLKGEIADAARIPSGCPFHPRCPYAVERCRVEVPQSNQIAPGHLVSCHRASELSLAGIRQIA